MASSTGRPMVRIKGEKDLSQIPDLITAFAVMQDLNIDMNGVSDMNDALARIRQNFRQSTAQQIYNEQDRVLKEAVSADRSNRQSLRELFEKANKYLQSLPAHFQTDLHHVFPNVYRTAEDTIQELQKNDCIIVVAGEKGAGKSSVVNLIAGCKILPTDMVHGTKTICELRHSETKKFVLHSWDSKIAPVVKECRNDSESRQFLQELTYHVTCAETQTQKSPYEKIDIFWPLPILGEGVVIVDSPGVGESNKVSRQLEHYMSRAFGFIYVINISNAGGIQKDRLGQLLRQAAERGDQGFDPSTALFVCNWWDQVKQHEQDHVLQETLRRLSRVLPGLGRQQVFPLSSTESLHAVEKGYVLDEYRDLVQGIRRVLPVTFNVKLSGHYRWLSAVLKRSLYYLKISTHIGRKEMAEKEAAFLNVRNQIEALESDAGNQIDVMRDGFRREVDNISRKLIMFLKSEACVSQMTNWIPTECPPPDKDVKKLIKESAHRFCEKLAAVVDEWDEQSKIVSKIKTNILNIFQRDLDLFEDQIKRIEGVLFEGTDNRIITDLHASMRQQMPVKNVWKVARKEKGKQPGDSGCFSLGSAISGCKNLDLKAAAVKNAFKNGPGPTAMAEVSKAFLQQYKDDEVASAIKKFFDRIAKRFDAASRLLPEFLKADRNLLQTLQGEVQGEQERLAGMYPKLMNTCTALQGTLDMFYVQRLMPFDFSMRELKYDPSKPIGRGSFADVFRCTLSTGEPVALKIQRDSLSPRNVTDVLLEHRTLTDIQHENIIYYYGAARERQGSDLRWVMVMEYCPRTIKQHFISDKANVPGRQEIVSLQMDAMREVAYFASQICSALCYLHNKGIVHRDLKPDNILLTKENVVKLTDVGLAKQARDIAGTLAGTPVYMAPEILLQKGQYDMKADVYSLAIILWELWYGMDAADHISYLLTARYKGLEDAIKNGLRPSVTMTCKPPEDWLDILQGGWDLNPAKRPHSREMADFFENFLKKTRR